MTAVGGAKTAVGGAFNNGALDGGAFDGGKKATRSTAARRLRVRRWRAGYESPVYVPFDGSSIPFDGGAMAQWRRRSVDFVPSKGNAQRQQEGNKRATRGQQEGKKPHKPCKSHQTRQDPKRDLVQPGR